MKKIIITLMAAMSLLSCAKYYDTSWVSYWDSADFFVTLKNYSSDDLIFFIPEKQYAENLPLQLSDWQKISVYEVKANSSISIEFDSDDNYETPIETYGVDDKMFFYIFKQSVWDSNSWEDLVNGKKWVACNSYSVEKIIALKRTISYPIK